MRLFWLMAACVVLGFGCGPRATAQSPHKDRAAFLAAEDETRRAFLEEYPFVAPRQMPKSFMDKIDATGRFDLSFAMVLGGKAEARKAEIPRIGAVKGTALSQLPILPFGDAMMRLYSRKAEGQKAKTDDAAVDRLALENVANYRALAIRYGTANGESFDSAPPVEKIRMTLDALVRFEEKLRMPCPLTVYLIDSSNGTEDGTSAEENDEDVVRQTVRFALGTKSEEYASYGVFSREEKTEALRKSYKALTEVARKALEKPAAASMQEYATAMHLELSTSGPRWMLSFGGQENETDAQLVLEVFGKAAYDEFAKQPAGPERDGTRAAAVVVFTYFRGFALGLLLSPSQEQGLE